VKVNPGPLCRQSRCQVAQVILPDNFPLNQILTWARLVIAYRVPTVSKAAGPRVAPAEVAPRRVVRRQTRAGSPDCPSEHILRTHRPARIAACQARCVKQVSHYPGCGKPSACSLHRTASPAVRVGNDPMWRFHGRTGQRIRGRRKDDLAPRQDWAIRARARSCRAISWGNLATCVTALALPSRWHTVHSRMSAPAPRRRASKYLHWSDRGHSSHRGLPDTHTRAAKSRIARL